MIKIQTITALTAILFEIAFEAKGFAMDTSVGTNLSSQPVHILDYDDLNSLASVIKTEFNQKGYIAIRGVPGFKEAYANFIKEEQNFIALPDSEKEKSTPTDSYARGWSMGIETLVKGKRDLYKGSYYAHIPAEENHPNIWPQNLPNFQERYTTLGTIMFNVGQKVLSLLGNWTVNRGLGRMLYYSPVLEMDNNPDWCGNHRDHGLFTALCPELFYQDGNPVPKPKGSGLYIMGQEISPPDDVMMFQIGEVMELMSNGQVTATDHLVKKAYGGYERLTFAFFFDTPADISIDCDNPTVLEKYKDRYIPGMTFQQWSDASYAKYNQIKS